MLYKVCGEYRNEMFKYRELPQGSMRKVVILGVLLLLTTVVAGQRTVGNMCEDFGTNGELCEYDYDASADRLTIHGRIDITGSGFARSCSDTYDNDNDGDIDGSDTECICGSPESQANEQQNRCLTLGNDDANTVQTDGMYCDNTTVTPGHCCPAGEYWDDAAGACREGQTECYQIPCGYDKNACFTNPWFTDASCLNTSATPTEACVYKGIQLGEEQYLYENPTPY
jgi:hypothetical protein